MAYDQASPYEAPRRDYYGGQRQQQAPAQQTYHDPRHNQYDASAQQNGAAQAYDHDQRGYGQGFEGQIHQNAAMNGYGQDVGQAYSQGYEPV